MSRPPTRAYVTIRGSRSNRQVHRDASPTSSPSPFPVSFPFAALVIGHPDGTSTRFELSYRPDAHLRDGSEGALVDLDMRAPGAKSITLCRVLVPADGHDAPAPSYPTSGVAPAVSTASAAEAFEGRRS